MNGEWVCEERIVRHCASVPGGVDEAGDIWHGAPEPIDRGPDIMVNATSLLHYFMKTVNITRFKKIFKKSFWLFLQL